MKDVVSYLRIMENPKDELAWRRVLGLYPKIGKVTIDKIWNLLEPQTRSDPDAFGRCFPEKGAQGGGCGAGEMPGGLPGDA